MIYKFADKYYFLSNFYEGEITYKGKVYKSVEHAYQAEKATSEAEHEWIRNAPTPAKAKSFGRKIKIKSDWDEIKKKLMLDLIRIKFQEDELRTMFLETGNEDLVEGNYWHDNTWGNCTCSACKKKKGQNWLGEILMKVRTEVKEEDELFN